MNKSMFFYDLPENLIAQTPLKNRDESRLLVAYKDNKKLCHKHFFDVLDYFNKGDCLVLNDTKVLPARIFCKNKDGKNIEILLLKEQSLNTWICLVKPGKHMKINQSITIADEAFGTVKEIFEDGERLIEFKSEKPFLEIINKYGTMPIPPYVKEKLEDQSRYQTVFAQNLGSAAAPTAGLHFTENLLCKIKEKGVNIAKVTLDVGVGTFRPVTAENIEDHHMHKEHFVITKENADLINTTRQNGNKIIACGTTSVRALESSFVDGKILPCDKDTSIFIYPPRKIESVDMLITNFHLPESTLLMLVSSFLGYETAMNAYKEAVKQNYRFFSFGDAMLCVKQ